MKTNFQLVAVLYGMDIYCRQPLYIDRREKKINFISYRGKPRKFMFIIERKSNLSIKFLLYLAGFIKRNIMKISGSRPSL